MADYVIIPKTGNEQDGIDAEIKKTLGIEGGCPDFYNPPYDGIFRSEMQIDGDNFLFLVNRSIGEEAYEKAKDMLRDMKQFYKDGSYMKDENNEDNANNDDKDKKFGEYIKTNTDNTIDVGNQKLYVTNLNSIDGGPAAKEKFISVKGKPVGEFFGQI